jgi:hypothetical protein
VVAEIREVPAGKELSSVAKVGLIQFFLMYKVVFRIDAGT